MDDPYDEFLVVEREELRKESLADEYNAKYWERRRRNCEAARKVRARKKQQREDMLRAAAAAQAAAQGLGP